MIRAVVILAVLAGALAPRRGKLQLHHPQVGQRDDHDLYRQRPSQQFHPVPQLPQRQRHQDELPVMSDPNQLTVMPPRAPRLPRDASISYDSHPMRLFICMTITKLEHIDALWDVLQHYAQQLGDDR